MPHKSQISHPLPSPASWLFVLFASSCLMSSSACAQFDAPPTPTPKGQNLPIKIVHPTLDKKNNSVSLPAAFWNQQMTNWVEVAACGRPSDFLHETIICTTTTKDIMMQAMRDVGFHDADAWVSSVRDFPRIRGDRFLITLEVTRKDLPEPKVEKYSLDELLVFQGWSVPAGPYGWMFKGDPERDPSTTAPATAPADPTIEDRTKIVRDDPQIALIFKGIQHRSQSYAEHPLAYDDWIYPMMRYARNYKLLPAAVYDSNGEIPVTMTLQKVNEEQFLTESAKIWHDPAYAKYMLEQLPIAKQIDKDKAGLWDLLPELKKLKATAEELRDAARQTEVVGQINVLAANIEKGYSELGAAWARWACDHPVFEANDDHELADLKKQVQSWRDHMNQRQKRFEQLAIAEKASFDLKQLDLKPPTDALKSQRQKQRGIELEARSTAMLTEDIQPREYWKAEQARLDPNDPRVTWKRTINAQVEQLDARNELGTTGLSLGRDLQSAAPDQIAAAQKIYAQAFLRVTIANLNVQLVSVDFEIEKRETFPDDPDLPDLKKQKQQIEAQLKEAAASTQPAPK